MHNHILRVILDYALKKLVHSIEWIDIVCFLLCYWSTVAHSVLGWAAARAERYFIDHPYWMWLFLPLQQSQCLSPAIFAIKILNVLKISGWSVFFFVLEAISTFVVAEGALHHLISSFCWGLGQSKIWKWTKFGLLRSRNEVVLSPCSLAALYFCILCTADIYVLLWSKVYGFI